MRLIHKEQDIRLCLWLKARYSVRGNTGHKGTDVWNIHMTGEIMTIPMIPRTRPVQQFSCMLRQWHIWPISEPSTPPLITSYQSGKYGLAIKDTKWCSSHSPCLWAGIVGKDCPPRADREGEVRDIHTWYDIMIKYSYTLTVTRKIGSNCHLFSLLTLQVVCTIATGGLASWSKWYKCAFCIQFCGPDVM